MANQQHVDLLNQGVVVWNRWRRANPDVEPNLYQVDFSNAELNRIDLSRSDLRKANFHAAKMNGADLRGANLREAVLESAQLQRANLKGATVGLYYVSGPSTVNYTFEELGLCNMKGADREDAIMPNGKPYIWPGTPPDLWRPAIDDNIHPIAATVLQDFCRYFRLKDYRTAYSLLSSRIKSSHTEAHFAARVENNHIGNYSNYYIVSEVNVNGSEAIGSVEVIRVDWSSNPPSSYLEPGPSRQVSQRSLALVKENGEWKIDSHFGNPFDVLSRDSLES